MKNNNQYISSLLKQKMKEVGINNYRQLSEKAKVSERQLYRLQNGLISSISVGVLEKIALALNISVGKFIDELTGNQQEKEAKENVSIQLEKEQDSLSSQQQEAIFILESLILQLPTIANAVEKNPQLPAKKLLPLLKPLDRLLDHWGIIVIGTIGEVVDFNPQEHELIDRIETNDGDNQDNFLVKVRYVGYRYQSKLLYRAKVSSVLD